MGQAHLINLVFVWRLFFQGLLSYMCKWWPHGPITKNFLKWNPMSPRPIKMISLRTSSKYEYNVPVLKNLCIYMIAKAVTFACKDWKHNWFVKYWQCTIWTLNPVIWTLNLSGTYSLLTYSMSLDGGQRSWLYPSHLVAFDQETFDSIHYLFIQCVLFKKLCGISR